MKTLRSNFARPAPLVSTMFALVAGLLLCPLGAHAQTYSRTETITYWDNPSKWVVGQTASVTCAASVPASAACNGDVISSSTYDPTYALPLTHSVFGKLQQTLGYDTTSTVASGQLGTLKTVADGNNNITTLTLWKRDFPQKIKYPATPEFAAGAEQTAGVNDAGWIEWVEDENRAAAGASGSRTCYGYDAMGRVNLITYPSEATAGVCDTSTWAATTQVFQVVNGVEYGIPAGHWKQIVTTGNGRKESFFDAMWRPLVTRDYDLSNTAATLRAQSFAYDHEGRVTFASYPAIQGAPLTTGTWTEYDALGRVTSVSQDTELTPSLQTTTIEYLTGFKTLTTSPKGQETTTSFMVYDQPSTDWPVAITHPGGAYTHINRDAFGKPTQLRRSNSSSPTGGTVALNRTYAYNTHQELCSSFEPETDATLMGYDGAGNLAWSAAAQAAGTACDPEGDTAAILARKVARTYDARNRIKTLVFTDGRGNQAWSYHPDGLPSLVAVTNPNVANPTTTTYTYNRRRLLTWEGLAHLGGTPWGAGYGYNANGHQTSLVYPTGLNVDFAPNALGQPTKAGTYATAVSYYPNGAIKQFTYGNGIVHTMTQNARKLPARSTDAGGGNPLDMGYTYDANANVGGITDYTAGSRQTRSMTYDALDRLLTAQSVMFGGDNIARYTYDVLDNLKTVKVNGRDHTYVYDAKWQLGSVKNTVGGDTVIGLGYDVLGNVNNRNGELYVFDYGNRLRSVQGKEWYAYDGHGRRALSCTTSACAYQMYSQPGQLLFTHDQRNNKRTEQIYLGGSLVAQRERPLTTEVVTVEYQHTDALGSPVAVTNSAGTIIERVEYEPYGKSIVGGPGAAASKDGPGYTGHVFDAATGMNYMQQRYYDPMIGRFLSVDPVAVRLTGDNFNRYAYVFNNPYRFTDPDGRDGNETIGQQMEWAEPGHMEMMQEGSINGLAMLGAGLDFIDAQVFTPLGGHPVGRGGKVTAGTSAKMLKGAVSFLRARVSVRELTRMSGMLRDAARGKGNFGIGSATSKQANEMGKAWVGKGASTASDGKTMVSKDGLRQYRPPSEKNSPHAETGVQANFEQRTKPEGQWQSNAHLDIKDH